MDQSREFEAPFLSDCGFKGETHATHVAPAK